MWMLLTMTSVETFRAEACCCAEACCPADAGAVVAVHTEADRTAAAI
jgi:hypothetical protein